MPRDRWDIRGVSIEPTYQPKPYAFDDPVAYPMYENWERILPLFVATVPSSFRGGSGYGAPAGALLHRFPDFEKSSWAMGDGRGI